MSSVAPQLGRELCAIGGYDEAESAARLASQLGVRQAGQKEQSSGALAEALERYERKHNIAMAEQTRARLAGKVA
jgi:hypothetical protein